MLPVINDRRNLQLNLYDTLVFIDALKVIALVFLSRRRIDRSFVYVAACDWDEFECLSSDLSDPCITAGWVCDGDNDCGDNSDEQDCGE